jgi:hypothetical protein
MRAETNTFEGPAAVWDADDQGRFRELAGTSFLQAKLDGTAVVVNTVGREQAIHPGYVVVLPEDGKPRFFGPDMVRVTSG